MEDERQKQEAGIPENAFRELKPGARTMKTHISP